MTIRTSLTQKHSKLRCLSILLVPRRETQKSKYFLLQESKVTSTRNNISGRIQMRMTMRTSTMMMKMRFNYRLRWLSLLSRPKP